jgi:DNA replication protein DnaC
MFGELMTLAKQLHISVLTSGSFAAIEGLSGEEYLLEVFRAEAKLREERATAERLRLAKLPSYKSFEEFDTDFQKGVTANQLEMLSKLEWLDALFNLILIGPPGTGKTHIALAIGNKAAREGYKVAFQTMDALIHILKTQEVSRKSQARLGWIRKCDLLIIDEMGYLPVSRAESNRFFALISELYENASVVITSNKGFEGWAELLGDAVLATALLDRLTHRCQVLSFSDDSYRLAHRKEIFPQMQ